MRQIDVKYKLYYSHPCQIHIHTLIILQLLCKKKKKEKKKKKKG